jgi:hypothetical protein
MKSVEIDCYILNLQIRVVISVTKALFVSVGLYPESVQLIKIYIN